MTQHDASEGDRAPTTGPAADSSNAISIREAAARIGVSARVLRRLLAVFELVQPVSTRPEIRLPVASLGRMRKAVRLHYELEVSWSSMALVLDLLERVEALENEIRTLRRQS